MRGKTASLVVIAGIVAVLTLAAESGLGQAAKPQQAGLPWAEFRSLGKTWQWHTLLGISPDGKKLLLGGSKVLAIYDLSAGKVVHVLHTQEIVHDASFSPDGEFLAVAEWRDGVTVRDAATMQVVQRLNVGNQLGAWQVRFSRDGRRLVGYSWYGQDKQFWSYNLQEKRMIGWPAGKNVDTARQNMREGLRGWGNHLFSVEKNYDNNGYCNSYRAWVTNAETGEAGARVELADKDYFQFDLDPEGGRAVVMQPGENPRVVDLKTGKTVITLTGHQRWTTCAAFSRDGKLLATASGTSEDGFARVYTDKYASRAAPTEVIVREAATGKTIAISPDGEKKYDFASLGFSPDGNYLWAQTRDKELLLWGRFPALPARMEPLPNFDSKIAVDKSNAVAVPATRSGDRFDQLIPELAASKRTTEQKIEALFLVVLGRAPTMLEQRLALQGNGQALADAAVLSKLLKVLVASPEFAAHVSDLEKRLPKKNDR
jgi:WD40 repeat protein